MRRFLRGLWKVDLALTLAVVIALCVVEFSHLHPTEIGPGANSTAAQANLQTAMTGAATFYASNHDSYVGIDGGPQLPAGVSSIAEIDIGLTFIAGYQASTGPEHRQHLAPSRSVLVMTAYGKGIQTCWGILRVARSRARPYFPAYPSHRQRGHVLFPWRLVVIGGLHGGNRDADGVEHELGSQRPEPAQSVQQGYPMGWNEAMSLRRCCLASGRRLPTPTRPDRSLQAEPPCIRRWGRTAVRPS